MHRFSALDSLGGGIRALNKALALGASLQPMPRVYPPRRMDGAGGLMENFHWRTGCGSLPGGGAHDECPHCKGTHPQGRLACPFRAEFRYNRAAVHPEARLRSMPFVVTNNCIRCKYTDCVEVCPVDCFHEGPNMLVIDPDECIDCTLCEPECPVDAIMAEEDVPEEMSEFIGLNAELAKEWPVIDSMKPAPEDADEWKDVGDKLKHLER